jgi:hypothetical protein
MPDLSLDSFPYLLIRKHYPICTNDISGWQNRAKARTQAHTNAREGGARRAIWKIVSGRTYG